MRRMKRLLLLVQIIFALCIAHETPSSEVCKDVGENGWFPGSDELFDEDCRTGVPPQLCNTDALKCGHGKCCVYHSVCGRGSALLGESPQMCRKATDCLAYGISSTISAKCVQGVCCRRKIVKRRFDPTVCPKDKSPDLCDCYKKKCRCDGKRKCYQYEKGKDKICCTDIFCKTGLLSGYDHRNGAVFLHDQRKKRTAYMEGHLLCSIPLSNELRNFIRPKWAYFAARKRYQARGFNAADPSLLPTCSSNKECLGGYCDVVFSLRRDESRKACFNIPPMFGRIVLEPHQTGFVHCLDSTDCKARNQFCFVGYSSFDRLNGICVKVPREKICQITKDCEKGYFCSPVYGKANLFGDPGLVVKICYSEPLTYIQKQRNPRTNDIFFCNSTCNAPDVYCETMKEEMLGFKGFCAHVKEVNNRYPLYTLVNGADCQNHEQCAWTDFYENLPQEDKFRYTRSCEAYESHWFCMHGELQQRHCADYEHPSLTSDGTTYYCVDRKQPTSTLPPPPPRPLPTPSPPTTEPPLSTGSSTSAPRTSTIEPDDDDDDDDFEASTSEEQGVTQVITTEDSAAKREEGLETTTVIVIAAVVAVGILIALAAVALFVIARNKKDKKAKKSKAHKKTKKMRGNSSSGKNSGNSGGSQSSSIAN